MKPLKPFIISILLIFSFVALVQASEKNCKTIKWRKGKVYVIKGAMYRGTHIILPEKLLQPPICANELWTCDGQLNHVLVMPNTAEKEGAEASMTVITETNTSYDFILKRVDQNPDTCVIILHILIKRCLIINHPRKRSLNFLRIKLVNLIEK